MKRAPEQYRQKSGMIATNSSFGNNGLFVIPHPKIRAYFFDCIISDDTAVHEQFKAIIEGSTSWEHVSVRLWSKDAKGRRVNSERCPTWAEMCFIKDTFWDPEETVVQYHPPHSEYVNNNEWTLHLWKPGCDLPRPESIRVGIK